MGVVVLSVWVRAVPVFAERRYVPGPRDRELFVVLGELGYATSMQLEELFAGRESEAVGRRVSRLVRAGLLRRWEFTKPYPPAYSLTEASAALVGARPPGDGLVAVEVLRVVAATEFYVRLARLGRPFSWCQGPWGFWLDYGGREYWGFCPRAVPGEVHAFWQWVRKRDPGDRLFCVAASEEVAVAAARGCPREGSRGVRYTWDDLLHSEALERAFRRWDGSGLEVDVLAMFA